MFYISIEKYINKFVKEGGEILYIVTNKFKRPISKVKFSNKSNKQIY